MPFCRIVGLFVIAVWFGSAGLRAASNEKPKLLVLVVFDQMRGDYLERWQKLFDTDGFSRLMRDGAWYSNCHYPYATTQTGPGHASMLTGCCPDQHGIVMNQWYDRKSSTVVNCAQSPRYQRVPQRQVPAAENTRETGVKMMDDMPTDEPKEKVRVRQAGSPDFILAPTLADSLKQATDGKARVVSLSFKDRSAILTVGKSADAAYWLDSDDGVIVTSSAYRDSVHPWVAEFSEAHIADQWFGKDWLRFRSDIDYARYSGPDNAPGEGTGMRQGVVFPHPMTGGLTAPGTKYYEALFNSPYGNDMLFELARRAVKAEKLGQHDTTDLLVVSFSSNDAIGHCWGPDSQEVLDVTLRSDRIVQQMLNLLDAEVGKGRYLLALTADHGICPLPEVSASKGLVAKRLSGAKLRAAAEEHLRAKFEPTPANPLSKTRFIESLQAPWVYLNLDRIENLGLKADEMARELADFLGRQEGIFRTFTRTELGNEFALNDPIGQRMKRSYYPDRCGDVAFVVTPFYLIENALSGTNHGTPHPYDTHVPLLFFGPSIKPGIRLDRVTPQTIATVFAQAAEIPVPRLAAYPAPDGLVSGK